MTAELPGDTGSETFDLRWRSFLDDLAWLGNNMHGGKSVSAVAAQSLPGGNIFWQVTRSARAFQHLQRVLAELKAVPGRPTPGDHHCRGATGKGVHYCEQRQD